jgi:beta-galactosidase
MQFNNEVRELRKRYQPNAKMPGKLSSKSTAILWNLENYWSIERQKITQQWDAWNYPVRYLEIGKSLGAPVNVIAENDDFSKYKYLIVPAYDLVDSALVKKWENYVADGGNLIITCRTATKNRSGHYWEAAIAAPLSNLIGAAISVSDKLPGNGNGDIVMKSNHYRWNNWGDLLIPAKNTEVLATYDNQFYKGTAAVVKNKIGKGTVTYIGVDTDDGKLEKDIIREMYTNAGVLTDDFPPGVFVYWRDGFYVAVNYSSNNYTIDIPETAKILVGEKILKPAGVCVWSE